jgi:DNA-binding ferritin-like protein
MNYSKIQGYTHLVRDENTNSIVNTNMSEYQEYISRRNIKNEENQKVQNIEEDLANMKNDIDEIKTLLRSLVNGS